MGWYPLILSVCFSVVLSCNRQTGNDIPECMAIKIEAMKSVPPAEPRRQVVRYLYNGHPVYYISAPCCDRMNELYDEQCNLVCSPDGGFTGMGDGRCPEFNQLKSSPVVIWEDDR